MRPRPATADLRHDAQPLPLRPPRRPRSSGAAWPPAGAGHRKCRAAGSNKAIVVSMEEPAWLPCSGSSVASRSRMICLRSAFGFEEELDEQAFDRPRVVADLVIAVGSSRLSSSRFNASICRPAARPSAAPPACRPAPPAPGHGAVRRVVQVLITQRDADDVSITFKVSPGCSTSPAVRVSAKQAANRSPPERTIGLAE